MSDLTTTEKNYNACFIIVPPSWPAVLKHYETIDSARAIEHKISVV